MGCRGRPCRRNLTALVPRLGACSACTCNVVLSIGKLHVSVLLLCNQHSIMSDGVLRVTPCQVLLAELVCLKSGSCCLCLQAGSEIRPADKSHVIFRNDQPVHVLRIYNGEEQGQHTCNGKCRHCWSLGCAWCCSSPAQSPCWDLSPYPSLRLSAPGAASTGKAGLR